MWKDVFAKYLRDDIKTSRFSTPIFSIYRYLIDSPSKWWMFFIRFWLMFSLYATLSVHCLKEEYFYRCCYTIIIINKNRYVTCAMRWNSLNNKLLLNRLYIDAASWTTDFVRLLDGCKKINCDYDHVTNLHYIW